MKRRPLMYLKNATMLSFATIAIGTCVFTGAQLGAKEAEREKLLNDVMNKDNEAYVEVVDAKKEELKNDFESGEITAKKYDKELKKINSVKNKEIFESCATDEEKQTLKDITDYEVALSATALALESCSLFGVIDTKYVIDSIIEMGKDEIERD